MRPLPTFDYVPIARFEPFHRHAPLSRCIKVAVCERSLDLRGMDDPARGTMIGWPEGMPDRSCGFDRPSKQLEESWRTLQPRPHRMLSTPDAQLGSKIRSKPRGLARNSLGGSTPFSVHQLGNAHAVHLCEAPITIALPGQTLLVRSIKDRPSPLEWGQYPSICLSVMR